MAGIGDNGDRPPTAAATSTNATTAAAVDGGRGPRPRDPCDCGGDAADSCRVQSRSTASTATADAVAVPKTSAVGSSLFTIDSILAPSRPADADGAVAGRNTVAAAAAAAAGFFKQPISFGHLAAAAAASGYAHSTAANFLGESTFTR